VCGYFGHLPPRPAAQLLADHKLDLMGLCGYGCAYCSSNAGNYLRIRRTDFARLTEEQLGVRTYPAEDPTLMFVWPDVLEKLEAQLARKPTSWGTGRTLMFSMLTDGFSPWLVEQGITRAALDRLLDRTSFRIRVLSKNAAVGSPEWVSFFSRHRERFVIGLSVGSLDDAWARAVEVGASPPSARRRALRALQAAGVPTFGMLCPMFPDTLETGGVERLLDAIDPDTVEHIWAEPYNDRFNWRAVRAGYRVESPSWRWFSDVYERGDKAAWSRYATELYVRLRDEARRRGVVPKLRYLLYEDTITEHDAEAFRGLEGVLLQAKPAPDGRSRNPFLARYQGVAPAADHERVVCAIAAATKAR
jgi:DNA repair photolyase